MKPVRGVLGVRRVALMAGLCLLAACAEGQPGAQNSATPALPKADYATRFDHFRKLQQAGLGGNYAAFAGHLKAADPAPVVSALQQSFRGGPFDVYTQKTEQSGARHTRLVELRSTSGRLYLMLRMDQVPGGWTFAGYDLARDPAALSAKR